MRKCAILRNKIALEKGEGHYPLLRGETLYPIFKLFLKVSLVLMLILISQSGYTDTSEPADYRLYHDVEPILDNDAELEDYVQYAVLNNPALEAIFTQWKAAIEEIVQAGTLPDPQVSYSYFINEVETRVGAQRHKYGVSQTLPWFQKLRLRKDVASQKAEAEYYNFLSKKLILMKQVKRIYFDYYYLSRSIAIVKESVQLLSNLEKSVRSRYKTARAEYVSVIKLQVELGKLEDRLREIQELRVPLMAQFNALLNRSLEQMIPWPRKLKMQPFNYSDRHLISLFNENNPVLKSLDYQIEKELFATSLAKKEFFPDITLGVDWLYTSSGLGAGTRDSGKDPFIATISMNVPLWFDSYNAGVRQAKARHSAASKMRINNENVLLSRLKLVVYNIRNAERKINLYRDTLIPKAKESLKVIQQAFETNKATFIDFIDTQRTVLEFELEFERAFANYHQGVADIEEIIGMEVGGD